MAFFLELFGSNHKRKRTAGWEPESENIPSGVIHSKRPKTEAQVHDLLKSLGVSDMDRVSACLKAAIISGHVLLLPPKDDPLGLFGLDQVLLKDECLNHSCDRVLTCRVRDVLYQSDWGGDHSDGGPDAPLQCPGRPPSVDDCFGIYVTGICLGTPIFDTGKNHNHCTEHPKFGFCPPIGKESHCFSCGRHYYDYGGRDDKCSCESSTSTEDSDAEDF